MIGKFTSGEEIACQSVEREAVVARCRQEIAEIEALIVAGHPDIQGLCLALSDWSAELRLLECGWQPTDRVAQARIYSARRKNY